MTAKHNRQKNKRSMKSKITLGVIVVLIGVLGFSLYQFLSVYIPQQREQRRFDELRDLIGEDEYEPAPIGTEGSDSTDPSANAIPDAPSPTVVKTSKYEHLFGMYEDMVGWLKVEGTAIDYPVMKTDREGGEYYLHRDVDGDYSFSGCLFIGDNCDADSDIFIIYGHNMNNGSMFGGLTDFGDSDYAYDHRDIRFDTLYDRRVYRVFAAFNASTYSEDEVAFKYYESVGKFDEAAYNDVLEQYRALSWVWLDEAPAYPAQIMLLSTCYTDKERFVVAAYRIQ